MKIALTGSTGFVGSALSFELARSGHEIFHYARSPAKAAYLPGTAVPLDRLIAKNVSDALPASSSLPKVDAIVHLMGESVADGRWTPERKQRLRDSRIATTESLVRTLAALPAQDRPEVLITASAVGCYGDGGESELDESSPSGSGFLAELTRDWEAASLEVEKLGVRVVQLRFGVILGAGGGALTKMQPVKLGSGRQWMSWVHLHDAVRMVQWALDNADSEGAKKSGNSDRVRPTGVFNTVAPFPVRNIDFTRALAKATRSPTIGALIGAPQMALKAALGQMSSMLLESQRVVPRKALDQGFSFIYPTIEKALGQIYGDPSEKVSRFSAAQFVPAPPEEVFKFFSAAENLEKITPPWLHFHIQTQSTPTLGKETLIDYRLRLHGLPLRWQSKIEDWNPPRMFVDTQTHGPYSLWHHTHRFEPVKGGTLMIDEVKYRLPLGWPGRLVDQAFVRGDVEKIFEYRKQKVGEIFSASATVSHSEPTSSQIDSTPHQRPKELG